MRVAIIVAGVLLGDLLLAVGVGRFIRAGHQHTPPVPPPPPTRYQKPARRS